MKATFLAAGRGFSQVFGRAASHQNLFAAR